VASLRKFQHKLKGRQDALVRAVAYELAREVIVGGDYSPGTPVDTGFARSSWYVRLGAGTMLGRTITPGAVPGGDSALAEASVLLLGAKAGESVFLLNDTEYILPLEYGHSQQAPHGMVRITVASGQMIVDKVAKRLTAS